MRRPFGAALAAMLGLTLPAVVARAQDGPPSPESVDLTLPPEFRGHPASVPAGATVPHRAARQNEPIAASGTAGAATRLRRKEVQSISPVDVGITVRGGSGTPRVNSATGSTQAVRESGSAIGAGMRFGF